MTWQIRIKLQLGTCNLDVDIEASARPVVLIGPNGSGKTTLLRAVAGAELPGTGLEGELRLDGRLLFRSGTRHHVPPEKRSISYVPQGFALFPHMSVRQNVEFGRSDRTAELLERFRLADLAHRYPHELSGGEQQRVALARAMATHPAGLLLDEPLASMDPRSRRVLRRELSDQLGGDGPPAIVVTHDVRDAHGLGGEVYVLESGRILQHGSAETLANSPASEFVAEFFMSD